MRSLQIFKWENHMGKIFCIGSNKTGTSSLGEALAVLGLSVCPWSIMFSDDSKYFSEQLQGKFESLFQLIPKYDCFRDRPWNHGNFYQILNDKFPDSKFILTIRCENNWIESNRRFSKKIKLKEQWFYRLISQLTYGIDDFLSDENLMKKKYNERNQEIIKCFENTNKLLVIDFEKDQGWNDLCTFLDREKPRIPFPHINRTK